MILNLIFLILIFLIFITLIFILFPLSYMFSFEYQDNFQYIIKIKTSFLKYQSSHYNDSSKTFISIFNYTREIQKKSSDTETEKNKEKEKKKKDKSKPEKPKKSKKNILKLINKENIKHILYFIKHIYQLIKPDIFNLNLSGSFSDPYYNGLILAFYYSLKGFYSDLPIKVDISWQKEVMEAQGRIEGNIIPVYLLVRLLLFIFSLTTLKIIWQIFKNRKEKK